MYDVGGTTIAATNNKNNTMPMQQLTAGYGVTVPLIIGAFCERIIEELLTQKNIIETDENQTLHMAHLLKYFSNHNIVYNLLLDTYNHVCMRLYLDVNVGYVKLSGQS
jgi:hypothetical protein